MNKTIITVLFFIVSSYVNAEINSLEVLSQAVDRQITAIEASASDYMAAANNNQGGLYLDTSHTVEPLRKIKSYCQGHISLDELNKDLIKNPRYKGLLFYLNQQANAENDHEPMSLLDFPFIDWPLLISDFEIFPNDAKHLRRIWLDRFLDEGSSDNDDELSVLSRIIDELLIYDDSLSSVIGCDEIQSLNKVYTSTYGRAKSSQISSSVFNLLLKSHKDNPDCYLPILHSATTILTGIDEGEANHSNLNDLILKMSNNEILGSFKQLKESEPFAYEILIRYHALNQETLEDGLKKEEADFHNELIESVRFLFYYFSLDKSKD